jgi:integrase
VPLGAPDFMAISYAERYAIIELGRQHQATNPKTGAYDDLQKTIENCPSPAKAAQIREGLVKEAESDRSRPARTHLATFAASWLISKKRVVKASTYNRYKTTLDLHIVPKLGAYFVDAITHADLVAWRDSFAFENSTVNGCLRTLKTMFVAATVELDLPKNPAQHVPSLPMTGGYDEDNPNSLEAHELAAFLEATKKHRPGWYPLFATLAFTGTRVSEATALKWTDVIDGTEDAPGKIIVRRSHWRGHVGTTKTGKARTVPLPQELASVLKDHRRALVAAQHPGLEEGWVFPARVLKNRTGKLIIHSSVRNALLKVFAGMAKDLEEAKAKGEALPPKVSAITVHGLRRTLDNLLRQHAAKEVTKAITGHVTDKMLEHYSTIGMVEKTAAVAQVIHLVRTPVSKSR